MGHLAMVGWEGHQSGGEGSMEAADQRIKSRYNRQSKTKAPMYRGFCDNRSRAGAWEKE